jgi:predicted dehydrogenase
MHTPPPNRRDFLKSSSILAAASLAAPAIAKDEPNSKRLKVGLIGCGGRGTGAAANALGMDTNAELWAMGDVFPGALSAAHNTLHETFKDRADVPAERQYSGLDAYQKVLASNPDVVILTTPPGFRPLHFAAAVESGKHIFCEKPVAVDITGIRSVLASAKKAKEKGLSVTCGFCWRYNPSRRAIFNKILKDKAIGDITHYYATYYTNPVKPMPPAEQRKAEWSDFEWQLRNWYNFSWLSGDSIAEQAVHSVDKTCWAMGDIDPISCIANGGRQNPSEGGNIYDHFNCVYEYPNNVFVHVANRQTPNCTGENADYISGTKGSAIINGDRVQILGENKWSYSEEESEKDRDMYDQEHVEFFESVRNGSAHNDGEWMAHSSLVAIMGRMAAYSGKKITWKQLLELNEDLAPEQDLQWGSNFTPHDTPIPGKYPLV